MLIENRRKAVIALSKSLDEMNVPSPKELQEKTDSPGGIKHYDINAYLTRCELKQLTYSLNSEISFNDKYKHRKSCL